MLQLPFCMGKSPHNLIQIFLIMMFLFSEGIIANLIEAVRTGMSSMSAMAATGWLLSRRKVEASRLPSGTEV